MLNNPLGYTDPSGHKACKSDYLCKRKAEKLWQKQNELLQSAVVIIFGEKGESDKNMLGLLAGGSDGTGVVVNEKRTVVTAFHVWNDRPGGTDTVLVMTSDGVFHTYDYEDVQVEELMGDAVKIILPNELPNVIPTQRDRDYDYSKPNQPVAVVYSRRTYDEKHRLTGYTLHLTTGVTTDNPVQSVTNWGYQLIVEPNETLQRGDSGGPVFSSNGLIGVNSGVSGSNAAVAPLCFAPSLAWLLGGNTWARPC